MVETRVMTQKQAKEFVQHLEATRPDAEIYVIHVVNDRYMTNEPIISMNWSILRGDVRVDASKVLDYLGIPHSIAGQKYITRAIMIELEHPGSLNSVVIDIYNRIGTEYIGESGLCSGKNVKLTLYGYRVERAIRYAIEKCVQKGNMDAFENIFGWTVNSDTGRPTNTEFIAMIADKLRLHYRNEGITPEFN